jgi:hypothetical protein
VKRLLIIGSGIAFWALVHGAPTIFGGHRGPIPVEASLQWLLLLPAAALVVIAFKPLDAMTYWAFPVSLVPALVLEPRLTAPEVYSGFNGVLALTAIALTGWGYIWAAGLSENTSSPITNKPERQPRLLCGLIATGSIAVFAAFAIPTVLHRDASPTAASLVLILGCAVVWLVLGPSVLGRFYQAIRSTGSRRALARQMLHIQPQVPRNRWTLIFTVLLSIFATLMWYLTRSWS